MAKGATKKSSKGIKTLAESKNSTLIKKQDEAKVEVVESKTNVPDDTIQKGIEAINELDKTFRKKKNILFSEDSSLLMQVEVIKISKCIKRKLRFKLPNSLVTDSSDICLFVCDLKRGKKVEHDPTVHHYEDILREKGITNIKSIIPVRQLRVEYDQLEMKRRLLTQYDYFLTDGKVSGLLAHKLGALFFKKNQLPTPIKMDAPDLKQEINKALHKTVLRLHGEGNTFNIRVGNGQLTTKQICENIQAVILQLAEQFPGGFNNVRSLYLKSPLSMAIPIYITLRNKNDVKTPIIKAKYNKNVVEGDLSTLLNASVRVHPNGKVMVIKRDRSDSDSDEDIPKKKPKSLKNVKETTQKSPDENDEKYNSSDFSNDSSDE